MCDFFLHNSDFRLAIANSWLANKSFKTLNASLNLTNLTCCCYFFKTFFLIIFSPHNSDSISHNSDFVSQNCVGVKKSEL